jgi:3-oxoacyl-[acyl-carrier protein] reductase
VLEGRRIMIVGGSRGIGAATAIRCAEEGADVVITYRSNSAAAQSVIEQIELCEVNGMAIKADATDEEAMIAAFAKAGPLDGLVISAGVFEPGPIREMSLEFWNRVLAANVTSSFLAVKHSLNTLTAGSIVLITSTAGQRGSSVYSAYATAKGAQIMFMRSMAKELAPAIRVNCVAPGWTETDMADSSLTELGRDEVAKSFPLGRIGQPNDVADAILFLLSDQSRFITGSTVTVDGGFDMRG